MLFMEKNKGEIKLKFKNIILHFNTITKHRWIVFKLSVKAGIPWRGLVHDLSKYSPTEFFEGVKYYQGNRSPIFACVEETGYSKARLHHRGRNKHHPQYWYDEFAKIKEPIMPYKYVAEMICDQIAASKTYEGASWTNQSILRYWNKVEERVHLNPKLKKMLTEIYKRIGKEGVNKVIKGKILKEAYYRNISEAKQNEYK